MTRLTQLTPLLTASILLAVSPVRAAVDTSDRNAVLAFYNAQYAPGDPVPAIGFTGDATACNAGTTSVDFRAAVAKRFNFMRGLAGLPDVTQDDALSALAQQSALMQSANSDLSHTPPASWTCYNDTGAQASAKSNLFLGTNGPDSIDGYIDEGGVLGHRRWVLFSKLQRFGTGDMPDSANLPKTNALYVITGDAGATTPPRDGFIAWPPKGFIPYRFAYGVWSFAVPGADLTGATVTMTDSMGTPVQLQKAGPLTNGYGDNTYSFEPQLPNTLPGGKRLGPRPIGGGSDLTYTVNVSNVKVNGTAQNYSYNVTLIDISAPLTDVTLFIPAITSKVASGTSIGLLRVVDPTPDSNPTYQHTLVAGDGSDDNASFTISNTCILSATVDIDFQQKPVWKIRVRVDNGHAGGTIEKAIVVSPFN